MLYLHHTTYLQQIDYLTLHLLFSFPFPSILSSPISSRVVARQRPHSPSYSISLRLPTRPLSTSSPQRSARNTSLIKLLCPFVTIFFVLSLSPLSANCERRGHRDRTVPYRSRPSLPLLVCNTDRHPLWNRRPLAKTRATALHFTTYSYSCTISTTHPPPVSRTWCSPVWLWLDLVPRPSLKPCLSAAASFTLVAISLARFVAGILVVVVPVVVVAQVVIENSCVHP
ncbi:hypothetical protein F4801DRAFT_347241 [Xylaria longipes]|nr:hypothetical protein F4801DRAFT_347241 [Xylaria longipes]